jgi:hypothetical protein
MLALSVVKKCVSVLQPATCHSFNTVSVNMPHTLQHGLQVRSVSEVCTVSYLFNVN